MDSCHETLSGGITLRLVWSGARQKEMRKFKREVKDRVRNRHHKEKTEGRHKDDDDDDEELSGEDDMPKEVRITCWHPILSRLTETRGLYLSVAICLVI